MAKCGIDCYSRCGCEMAFYGGVDAGVTQMQIIKRRQRLESCRDRKCPVHAPKKTFDNRGNQLFLSFSCSLALSVRLSSINRSVEYLPEPRPLNAATGSFGSGTTLMHITFHNPLDTGFRFDIELLPDFGRYRNLSSCCHFRFHTVRSSPSCDDASTSCLEVIILLGSLSSLSDRVGSNETLGCC